MGLCLGKEYVTGQELINNQLRQDVAQALETVKQFQNTLHETPQSKVELEALKLIITHQRELTELKNLAAIRQELDALKANLKLDPSLALADVQDEIKKIQEKIVAMKEVKGVASQISPATPPFASLTSSNQGWAGSMTAGFEIIPEGFRVHNAGLYQIYAIYSPFGYNPRTRCTIFVNGELVAAQGQTDGGPTFVYHLVKLAENDVISAVCESAGFGGAKITFGDGQQPHNRIQVNLLLIK